MRAGTSLVETLAAMAVLGGAVLSIASLLLFSMRTQARAAERTQLAALCRDRIEALLALPDDDPGLADGADTVVVDVGRGHRGYSRAWTVTRDAIEPGIVTIEVTARATAPRPAGGTVTLGAVRTPRALATHRDL